MTRLLADTETQPLAEVNLEDTVIPLREEVSAVTRPHLPVVAFQTTRPAAATEVTRPAAAMEATRPAAAMEETRLEVATAETRAAVVSEANLVVHTTKALEAALAVPREASRADSQMINNLPL